MTGAVSAHPMVGLDLQDKIIRARTDFKFFCIHFVRILTKEDGLQPLRFNYAQRKLWELIQECKRLGKPVRVVILKARQMGMSTFIQAYLFWKALTAPETASMVLCHDDESSMELFGKIELMYDELENIAPEYHAGLMNIQDTSKKGRKKQWGTPLHTSITVKTAGAKTAGRSRTLRRVHLSEYAFYDDPKTMMLGLQQAIGRGADTEIFVESTANGIGNEYQRLWKRATSGTTGWRGIFFGWNEEPTYRETAPAGFKPDKKERKLARRYKLDFDQLQWRRTVIADDCDGDEGAFRQEYPIDPREAFLVTGNPYFGRAIIERYDGLTSDPASFGWLDLSGETPVFTKGEGQDELDAAPWRIWKKPVPGRAYGISADPAGGTSEDYSFAAIIDMQTLEFVATYQDRIDPDDFARQLAVMGYTYNTALIGPEKNGEGRATVLHLKKTLLYPRVFFHVFEDQWDGGVQSNDGWRTSAKTRPTMLAQARALLRDDAVKIHDDRITSELLSFVRVEGSKIAAAQSGTHDDGVMTMCIGLSDEFRQQASIPWISDDEVESDYDRMGSR